MGSFAKFNKKQQSNQLQEQLAQIQEKLRNTTFTGISGNGLVQVIIDGEKSVKSIKIKPECVDPSDTEGLEDLLMAAFEHASTLAEQEGNGDLPF